MVTLFCLPGKSPGTDEGMSRNRKNNINKEVKDMLLNKLIEENFGSQRKASIAIGVNEATLSKVLSGKESPSKHFKKKVEDFFSLYFNEPVEFIKDDDIIKAKDSDISSLKIAYVKLYALACSLNAQLYESRTEAIELRKKLNEHIASIETFDMSHYDLNHIMKGGE